MNDIKMRPRKFSRNLAPSPLQVSLGPDFEQAESILTGTRRIETALGRTENSRRIDMELTLIMSAASVRITRRSA